MVKTTRPAKSSAFPTHRPGEMDAPWKHDRFAESLSRRMARPGSLTNRIAGAPGQELLPDSSSSRMRGFDQNSASGRNGGTNAGVELFPDGPAGSASAAASAFSDRANSRLVARTGKEMLEGALGRGQRREREQPRQVQIKKTPQVSIMGAAKTTTWVKVQNLAPGTTADDVVSAFAPLVILQATDATPSHTSNVTIDLELESRSDAEGLIRQYHGVVADGNTLSVTIVNGLKHRLGGGVKSETGVDAFFNAAARSGVSVVDPRTSAAGQELLGGSKTSKLYSDTVLATDPSATIITLADEEVSAPSPAARRGNDSWSRGRGRGNGGGGNLASRMRGGGAPRGRGGRGQIGGGSFHDMLVD
ncbi:hypothetical protein IAT38_006251 [Cryptococcus sp. DSM 104549]